MAKAASLCQSKDPTVTTETHAMSYRVRNCQKDFVAWGMLLTTATPNMLGTHSKML